MPRMSQDDFRLSMQISRRARRPGREEELRLRELHVHRLTDTEKAVGRAALQHDNISVFCEPCSKWIGVKEFPLEWDCPHCGRPYRAELVVYEEVTADDDEPVAD